MSRCVIVIPCFNEAARLDVDALQAWTGECANIDLLFVDDGSTDATGQVLEMLVHSNPERFSLYRLPHNMGKAEAVRRGILYALAQGCQFVGFWDADLATPLQTIQEFCDLLEQNSSLTMVMGSRVRLLGRRIDRRPLRHYLGRMFATMASAVVGLAVYDTQCGAKVFRCSPEIHEAFAEAFRSRWIFDVELLARLVRIAKLNQGRKPSEFIYEVPLVEWRDVAGSKVKFLDFFKAGRELMSIYWRYFGPRRSARRRPHSQVAVVHSAVVHSAVVHSAEITVQLQAARARLPSTVPVEACGLEMAVSERP